MASDKKKRKAARLERKAGEAPSPLFRHRDGDRRRRTGPLVRAAIRRKEMMRQGLLPPESSQEKTGP